MAKNVYIVTTSEGVKNGDKIDCNHTEWYNVYAFSNRQSAIHYAKNWVQLIGGETASVINEHWNDKKTNDIGNIHFTFNDSCCGRVIDCLVTIAKMEVKK